MFVWRNALILGLIFMVVGVIYWYVQAKPIGTSTWPARRCWSSSASRWRSVRRPAARVARAVALDRAH